MHPTKTYLVRYLDTLGYDREAYVRNSDERTIRADAMKAGYQILVIKAVRM